MNSTYITGIIRAFLPLVFSYLGYELTDSDLTILSAAFGGLIAAIWSVLEKKTINKKLQKYY
jgi:hypothetical protein